MDTKSTTAKLVKPWEASRQQVKMECSSLRLLQAVLSRPGSSFLIVWIRTVEPTGTLPWFEYPSHLWEDLLQKELFQFLEGDGSQGTTHSLRSHLRLW